MKRMTPEIARHKQEELRELLDYDPEAEARFMRGDKWLHWVPSVWYKPWTWNFYWGKWTVKLK